MDGIGGYLPGIDQPIKGAVIRSVGAENFISYSKDDGHYAAYGFTAADVCRSFATTAIHPQTMNRVTANITTCETPYIVNNLNFKLADKDTAHPDTTAPVISMNMQVVSGQPNNPGLWQERFLSAQTSRFPSPYSTRKWAQPCSRSRTRRPTCRPSVYPAQLSQTGSVVHTYITRTTPVAVYRYTYQPAFGSPYPAASRASSCPGSWDVHHQSRGHRHRRA